MPTYEYACDVCGRHMEVVQRMGDARLTQCPVCGKPELKRLISGGQLGLGSASSSKMAGTHTGDRILRMANRDKHSKTCHRATRKPSG